MAAGDSLANPVFSISGDYTASENDNRTSQRLEMTIHCANCGFENPTGMRFCGNCGTRLIESTAAPAEISPLFERFREAGLKAAGQRRNVTVLFADLSGYTSLSEKVDSEEIFFIVQEYLKLLTHIVYRYDGFVDKYTGDGIMALFGAPITQENNAELAVRAALDMQAELKLLSARLPNKIEAELLARIGLNTGTVVVGSVGSDLQMNYTAIGDTVNLASRLEGAAMPGSILVSETVYHQTRSLFEFIRQPPQLLKGISHPITAYQLVGVRERPDSVRGLEGLRSPMIGREAELARLSQTLDALAYHQSGGLVIISGEAGLGKSRLAAELKARVPLDRVQVFEGHSLTYRRGVSYWMFLDLVRNVLSIPPNLPDNEVSLRLSQRLEQRMGSRGAQIQPLLERAFSLKPSNPVLDERLDLLEAGQLRQRIFLAFREWLLAEARSRPLLLIFEDLHWADDASLDLLQFLIDSTRDEPLLVYAISRPYSEGVLQAIHERAERRLGGKFAAISLQTLSPDQSELLLNNLLALTLPDELRREILQRSAGNPFYLEEILRMLIDQGVIRRESGQLQLVPGADLASLGVPETLKGLILSRFDRLEALPRQFLQTASAVGRRFNLTLVQTVMGLSQSVLEQVLPVLVDHEFISPLPDAPESEYQFLHVLVSDAVYSTLLDRNRSELHGRIGEAIEQLYADHIEEQLELLARHYSWSTRRDRALHYLILAARKSAGSFLNQQASQYYQEALALLPQVEHTVSQELQIYSGLGDALLFLGEYSQARDFYQNALSLTGRLVLGQQVQVRSNLQRQIGTTFERQGDYEQALKYLDDAQAALAAVSARYPVDRARVLNDIGWTYFRRGQIEEAEKFLQRALWTVEPSSQPGVVASIYNRLGGVYFIKDDLKAASDYVRKSLELRKEAGDIAGVARTYNNLGVLEWRQGHWDDALAEFKRSFELQADLNDVEGMVDLHYNIGLLLADQGHLAEAHSHLEEGQRIAQQIGHIFLEALGNQFLGYYFLLQKQWEQALDCGQRGLATFENLNSQENIIDTSVTVGIAWLNLGQMDRAASIQQIIHALLNGREDPRPSLQKGRALRLDASICVAQGDFDRAQDLFNESARQFTALDNQLELGRTLSELAWLAHVSGDPLAASSYASQARAIFRALGARLDLQAAEETGL